MEKWGGGEEERNQNSKLICERQQAEREERETELVEQVRLQPGSSGQRGKVRSDAL